ncbi:HNH endonuclease [Oscillibacter sp.]|uniref:HNH endonuclease n=1 Tax=Oscillibacter sp. TaxID=1945593 RepID=UPI0028A10C05|nr:HNH endonuclease [Oscillibacter sp.]
MNRRTKALDIPARVKKVVYARDNGLCILCGSPGAPNAHYVSRGQSGLGIPENVVTLCRTCHRAYDQSTQREILKNEIAGYLRSKYPGWDDIRLTYLKGD